MVYPLKVHLCFIVLLLSASLVVAATEEEVVHKTFPLNEQGIVDLSNVNGDVTIRGWDKNEVDMKATKRGPSYYLDLIEIKIDSTPARLSIDTKYPRGRKEANVSVTYELTVPKHAVLDAIHTVNGGIEISGVEGEIKINTVNGSAEIEGSKSTVDAETVNGRITATWLDFPKQGDVSMRTVNGGLKLHLPNNANADVKASSMNGTIRTDFPITVQGRFVSRSLSGKIGEGGTNIDLETINGSIDILKTKN
ncbi:DUF4097 family beta strand repeat-containing protein [bacterium]|nr:DUF4097 family beta strand repeat-containing protein [bacterium]